MQFSASLDTTLRHALARFQEALSSSLFLVYNTAMGTWSVLDGSNINDVWLTFGNPDAVVVLRLEPAATRAAIAADPFADLEEHLRRYATFTCTRPRSTGLHHFIEGPPPISDQPTFNGPQEVKP